MLFNCWYKIFRKIKRYIQKQVTILNRKSLSSILKILTTIQYFQCKKYESYGLNDIKQKENRQFIYTLNIAMRYENSVVKILAGYM